MHIRDPKRVVAKVRLLERMAGFEKERGAEGERRSELRVNIPKGDEEPECEPCRLVKASFPFAGWRKGHRHNPNGLREAAEAIPLPPGEDPSALHGGFPRGAKLERMNEPAHRWVSKGERRKHPLGRSGCKWECCKAGSRRQGPQWFPPREHHFEQCISLLCDVCPPFDGEGAAEEPCYTGGKHSASIRVRCIEGMDALVWVSLTH